MLETIDDRLALAGQVEVDMHAARSVTERLLDGECVSAIEIAPDVLAQDLLPDWDEEWLTLERERFRQYRLHGLEALSERLAAEGCYGRALEAGMAAVAADPLRETAHRAVIRAHLAEGNQGEALRQYRACCELLRDPLDVAPSMHLERLLSETLNTGLARR